MFDVIYADPPWPYANSGPQGGVGFQYRTTDENELAQIDVKASPNSVMYMWATAPKLPEAIQLMKDWGFSYKTCLVWDKKRLGIGYWARGQHELLLIGVKGKVKPPPPELRIRSVYSETSTKHSKKPAFFVEYLERLYPDAAKLEMFARNDEIRPGWTYFGDEARN